jgi:HlyD family secretion protein
MQEENNIELRSEEFQEVLGSVPHWILRGGIVLLAIVVLVLLAGSAVFKYPDTISAPIVLTGTTPPATIVARSSGKLNELYVSDNQEVKAGDFLAVINNPAHTEAVLNLKNYLNQLDIENNSLILPEKELVLGDLQSVYSSFYTTLFDYLEYKRLLYYPQKVEMTKERILQYESQYRNMLRQQQITKEQFVLTGKQFQRDSILFANKIISQEEFEKSQSVYLQGALSDETMRSSIGNMQIQIAQLKESLLDTEQQAVEKVNSLHSNLQSLISQLKTEIQNWEMSYVLMAPIDGKITFINYWTINQNILAGEEIFTIIPMGWRVKPAMTDSSTSFEIIGKASLPIARSGKVQAGQKVNIRIDNFPDTEFGMLRGVVQNISLVPSQSGESAGYAVEIALPEGLVTTYKKELPYLPTMQGQAEIITEDISLLERLIMPVRKIFKENIGE